MLATRNRLFVLQGLSLFQKRLVVPYRNVCLFHYQSTYSHILQISSASFSSKIDDKKLDEEFLVFRDVTVGELLDSKDTTEIGCANEEETVFEAIQRMVNMKIGSIVVKNSKGITTGIFTERDYLKKIALAGLTSKTTKVKDVMTKKLIWVDKEKKAKDCMEIMTKNRFRHLPVLSKEGGDLLGMISIGDLVNAVLHEYRSSVQFYREYIDGRYSQ